MGKWSGLCEDSSELFCFERDGVEIVLTPAFRECTDGRGYCL